MIDIGEVISNTRKEKGIKQKQLAEMCGLSVNSIVSIEKGKHIPTKENLNRICFSLNISKAYLVLSCLTKEDLKKEHEVLFDALIEPLKQYLIA